MAVKDKFGDTENKKEKFRITTNGGESEFPPTEKI